jgi:hypothetical protein
MMKPQILLMVLLASAFATGMSSAASAQASTPSASTPPDPLTRRGKMPLH